MSLPDSKIVKVIQKHHILTLATSHQNRPYCCTCFYTYLPEENIFVILSENDTRHIAEALENKRIAGAIALETKMVGKIRGVQFTGKISKISDELLDKYRAEYIKKFIYVKHFIGNTPFWIIEPDFLKLTDNNLGFGKKIIWNSEQ